MKSTLYSLTIAAVILIAIMGIDAYIEYVPPFNKDECFIIETNETKILGTIIKNSIKEKNSLIVACISESESNPICLVTNVDFHYLRNNAIKTSCE